MIALLDINNGVIKLYGENGIKEVPISEVSTIENYITGNLYYITNAIEVNADDLINLVYSLKGTEAFKDIPDDIDDQQFYVHAVKEGTLYIDESLKFEGIHDCHIFDEDLKLIIEESTLLQNLLKKKKIEIIGEKTRRKLLGDLRIKLDKKAELQKQEDDKLDRLLVDRPAHEVADAGIIDTENDVAEIDMDSDREDNAVPTEAEENLKIVNRMSENKIE